jgi:UPF0755 protein
MKHFSKSECVILFLLFILVALAVFGSRAHRLYTQFAIESDAERVLLLYERTGLEELSEKLDSLGLDVDKTELLWAGQTLGWRTFSPGRYEIEGHTSYSNFLSKLARGMQDPARVTILPGTDIGRFSRSMAFQMRPDSVSFGEIFSDSSEIALEAGLTGGELFSRMLPNSYDVYWTSSAENMVRRILREFNQTVVERLREEIEEHPLSLEEIITLASIVEWEARQNEEKPRISGLYLNRLDRDMMLQADPTVIYALGERRRLFFEDYQIDHPYNTYQVEGLPPGPITNPDLASIRAVLNPEEHEYLYMVATPEGSHRFSRTFEEHRQASEEWRRWIREQHEIRDQREREQEQEGS